MGHDVVEIFESDESVVVEMGSFDHGLDFLVGEVFSDVLGDFFQFKTSEFSLR